MVEENISQEFRLKNVDETRNYFLEEIKQNELMSKKHKKVCKTPNYTDHVLILASTIARCISVSAFASLIGILMGITSPAIKLKFFAIRKRLIKKKKKKKKLDKIVFLAKSKLNKAKVLISKALNDSVISHDEFC